MKNILPLTCFSLLLVSTPTQAALVFSDDFESYTSGQAITTTNWTNVLTGTSPGAVDSATVFVQTDTSNQFGLGTGNQYVDLWDNSPPAAAPGEPNSIWLTRTGLGTALAGGVATLNMDIIEPSGTFTGRILIGIGDNIMAANDRANNINWNENPADTSTFGGFSVDRDQLYNLNVVFNNNLASIQYDSPTGLQTLDATSADIWLDGVLVVENVTQDRTWDGGTAIDAIGFRSFSGDLQRLLVDNFSVYDEAIVVPEPSTAFLGMASLFGFLAMRRRKA